MKSLMLCCALVAQTTVFCFGQSASNIIPTEQRSHNFGDVTKASKIEHRFVLRNPYQSEMRIGAVRASCGCTTPILESQVVKPGESTTLIAHFNTDRFTGEKKATLTVSILQPVFTELQLNVRGYIRSDIVVNPGEAAFGSVPEASQKKLALTLDYAGKPDWKIENIVVPFEFLQSDFREVSRGNGRVKYEIDLTLDSNAPEGFVENQIIVQTNDLRRKSFPISFSASVDKPIKTAPASLALGSVKPNEPIVQRLTITSKSEVSVAGVSSKIAEVRGELPSEAKRVHMLSLTIMPKLDEQKSGEVKGSLEIHLHGDSSRTIEIPMSFTFELEKFANTKAQ